MWKNIALEETDSYIMLTLSRPQVLNALNLELMRELEDAVAYVLKNDKIRALIITGNGEKAFAAGADISELQEISSAPDAEQLSAFGQKVFTDIESLPMPVIMAINGYTLGGGFELAMCGDILIASENARFGQPEVNLGIIPGYGGTQRLTRAVGKYVAKYLCLTGEMLSAEEALKLGLVQKVVPSNNLLLEAKKLASELAKKAPVAMQYIKMAIDNGSELGLLNGLQLESAYFGITFDTKDRSEGMDAFMKKRPPSFVGK